MFVVESFPSSLMGTGQQTVASSNVTPAFSLMLGLIAELENGIGLGESDPVEQAETAYLIVATAPEVCNALIRSILGLTG